MVMLPEGWVGLPKGRTFQAVQSQEEWRQDTREGKSEWPRFAWGRGQGKENRLLVGVRTKPKLSCPQGFESQESPYLTGSP